MAMVFTMVSAIQEELHCLVEQSKQRKDDIAAMKKRAEEELERVSSCFNFQDLHKKYLLRMFSCVSFDKQSEIILDFHLK